MPQPDLLASLSPNTGYIEESRGDVKIFFVYKGDTIQIPVNPDKLSIKSKNGNKVVPVVSLGEVNILKEPKLKTISFKSFFPVASTQNYPYVLTGNYEANFYSALIKQILGKQNKNAFILPEKYVEIFESIRKNKEPVRFIVLGLPQTINGLFSVERFDYGYEEGDSDITYEMELKSYQLYSIKECVVDANGNIIPNDGVIRVDDSDSMLAPYSGCKVNVTGNIYKDPAMQFVDRYVKNLAGVYVDLIDFDNNGAVHLRDSEDAWIGWAAGTSVTKATGMI